MFNDLNRLPTDAEDMYVRWECAVENLLRENPGSKLVILELGCGVRVGCLLCRFAVCVFLNPLSVACLFSYLEADFRL